MSRPGKEFVADIQIVTGIDSVGGKHAVLAGPENRLRDHEVAGGWNAWDCSETVRSQHIEIWDLTPKV